MSDAIFVLNAGSSSLKFSAYGLADQDLSVVAHGEIEGLGASAHFEGKGSTRPSAGRYVTRRLDKKFRTCGSIRALGASDLLLAGDCLTRRIASGLLARFLL